MNKIISIRLKQRSRAPNDPKDTIFEEEINNSTQNENILLNREEITNQKPKNPPKTQKQLLKLAPSLNLPQTNQSIQETIKQLSSPLKVARKIAGAQLTVQILKKMKTSSRSAYELIHANENFKLVSNFLIINANSSLIKTFFDEAQFRPRLKSDSQRGLIFSMHVSQLHDGIVFTYGVKEVSAMFRLRDFSKLPDPMSSLIWVSLFSMKKDVVRLKTVDFDEIPAPSAANKDSDGSNTKNPVQGNKKYKSLGLAFELSEDSSNSDFSSKESEEEPFEDPNKNQQRSSIVDRSQSEGPEKMLRRSPHVIKIRVKLDFTPEIERSNKSSKALGKMMRSLVKREARSSKRPNILEEFTTGGSSLQNIQQSFNQSSDFFFKNSRSRGTKNNPFRPYKTFNGFHKPNNTLKVWRGKKKNFFQSKVKAITRWMGGKKNPFLNQAPENQEKGGFSRTPRNRGWGSQTRNKTIFVNKKNNSIQSNPEDDNWCLNQKVRLSKTMTENFGRTDSSGKRGSPNSRERRFGGHLPPTTKNSRKKHGGVPFQSRSNLPRKRNNSPRKRTRFRKSTSPTKIELGEARLRYASGQLNTEVETFIKNINDEEFLKNKKLEARRRSRFFRNKKLSQSIVLKPVTAPKKSRFRNSFSKSFKIRKNRSPAYSAQSKTNKNNKKDGKRQTPDIKVRKTPKNRSESIEEVEAVKRQKSCSEYFIVVQGVDPGIQNENKPENNNRKSWQSSESHLTRNRVRVKPMLSKDIKYPLRSPKRLDKDSSLLQNVLDTKSGPKKLRRKRRLGSDTSSGGGGKYSHQSFFLKKKRRRGKPGHRRANLLGGQSFENMNRSVGGGEAHR